MEKISVISLFILLKKVQAVVQKTSRQNVTSTVLILFFLFFLFDGGHGWKNHNQLKKNSTKIEKVETHAHRKRVRSALSRERTLELRR